MRVLPEDSWTSVLTPVTPIVTPIRAPIVTVLCDGRRADNGSGSRNRAAAEYSPPASTSWA